MHTSAMVLALLPAVVAAAGEPNTVSSAELCGACHRSIHQAWKESAHSRAMEDRLFQDALALAEAASGPGARAVCLKCHAPLAVHGNDLTLQKKVSWEGVTCDFCHSVREVSSAGPNVSAKLEITRAKAGTRKGATSPAHSSVYSDVHSSSLLCATCHEYKNTLGFAVLTTYSEWKASPAAKAGKQCQDCHMYYVTGDVMDPLIKKPATDKVNLHQMPGSRSAEQLNKAIRVDFSATRKAGTVFVDVDISNRTAGHFVPTGSPLRQLTLDVAAIPFTGQRQQQQRAYRRTVADESGRVLDREHQVTMKGSKVVSDTRLAPGEHRRETFQFSIPAGIPVRVQLTLGYYYSPLARTEDRRSIVFRNLSRMVR